MYLNVNTLNYDESLSFLCRHIKAYCHSVPYLRQGMDHGGGGRRRKSSGFFGNFFQKEKKEGKRRQQQKFYDSDDQSESGYELQHQRFEQFSREEVASDPRDDELHQRINRIEKRLANIETQMQRQMQMQTQILQILTNQRADPVPRAEPVPRTKPTQTVSLSRATGKETRAQQKAFHLSHKNSRGANFKSSFIGSD